MRSLSSTGTVVTTTGWRAPRARRGRSTLLRLRSSFPRRVDARRSRRAGAPHVELDHVGSQDAVEAKRAPFAELDIESVEVRLVAVHVHTHDANRAHGFDGIAAQ